MKPFKAPTSLYSRLALITSVTLVVGYFVVYAAWSSLTDQDVEPGATITTGLMTKIKDNFDNISSRVTTLEGSIAGASVWSKVGSDINYTAGKVGIGTASPNKDLHVYNTTANAEINLQSTATAGSHWGIYHNSPDQSLRFWHSGVTDAMTILPSGNVGIGTADPVSFKLHVDDVLGQMQLKSTTGTNRVNYRLKNTGGDVLFGIDSSIGGQISIGSSVYSAVINHAGNYPMQFGTNNTVRMTISNDGNVGIGTTNPQAKLAVTNASAAVNSLLLANTSGNTGDYQQMVFQYSQTDSSYRSAIRSRVTEAGVHGGNLSFWTDTIGATLTERMTINRNGNVGIGTTAPTYQLQLSTDSAAKPTSSTWTIASDRRIKKDIDNFTDGLDAILALQPRTYKYNGGGGVGYDDTETHIGIVAQEVEKVAPYMVETRTGTIDGKEVSDFKTYQGHALPFILVNAVKELKSQKDAENQELNAQILELKNEIQELRNK